MFSKFDLINLVTSAGLMELIGLFCATLVPMRAFEKLEQEQLITTQVADRRCVQAILSSVIEVVLDFRDRDMYDRISINYVKSGILAVLVKSIIEAGTLPPSEYQAVARIFELCACHKQGIAIMAKYLS